MKPHQMVRRKRLGEFIPLGETELDLLIRKGLLKAVKLKPGGRSIGFTMETIAAYQQEHMGLTPLPDDESEAE